VAAAKYFHALEDGLVPLTLLFSGTIFYEAGGALRVAQIPWNRRRPISCPCRLKQMMEHYYPGVRWLCLQHEAFTRLYRYKSITACPVGNTRSNGCCRGSSRAAVVPAAGEREDHELAVGAKHRRCRPLRGYILYPYRPSAIKNRQRFTFGVSIHPIRTAANRQRSQ